MKTLEFIYQSTEIHFLVNPSDKNVMVNATEMAKMFNKRVDVFMKTDHAKAFISILKKETEQPPNGGRSESKIIDNRGHMGIYFERRLALKFAAWLSPEFEVWIFSTIDEIVFGNYRKHWEAHARQEAAKMRMEVLKEEMLLNPTHENVTEYFYQQREFSNAKKEKTAAIRNQLKLFGNDD